MTYRFLEPQEFERLQPIFQQMNDSVPCAELAEAFVAEEDGEIRAVMVRGPVQHVECAFVQPEFRGLVNIRKMFNSVTSGVGPFMSLVSSEKLADALESWGMKKEPWSVMVGKGK